MSKRSWKTSSRRPGRQVASSGVSRLGSIDERKAKKDSTLDRLTEGILGGTTNGGGGAGDGDASVGALTTVTGVTEYREAEGPTIYVEDDDDVSQITSSVAGNTIGSSSYYFGSTLNGGDAEKERPGRSQNGSESQGPESKGPSEVGLGYIISSSRSEPGGNQSALGSRERDQGETSFQEVDLASYAGDGRSTRSASATSYSSKSQSSDGRSARGSASVSTAMYASPLSPPGSGSRFVPSRRPEGSPLASIIFRMLGHISAALSDAGVAAEPAWVKTRRVCCDLRRAIDPRSVPGRKKYDDDWSSHNEDDFFSKIMGPALSPSSSGGRRRRGRDGDSDQSIFLAKRLFLILTIFWGLKQCFGRQSESDPAPPPGTLIGDDGRSFPLAAVGREPELTSHSQAVQQLLRTPGAKIQRDDPTYLEIEGRDFDATSSHNAGAGGMADALPGTAGDPSVEVPLEFDSFADIDDVPLKNDDLPFFWHIPRSGGGTTNDIMGGCLGLTLASDAGGREGHGQDEVIKEVVFPNKVKYVNVDTSTVPGIERAKSLDMAESGLADAVVTSLLYDGASLFDGKNRARMFTIFRHPVDRAVSLFHFLQDTVWRRTETFDKMKSKISIDEYYKGGMAESNWMTRFLSNELSKELDEGHVEIAKGVIRRKCLVGLLSEKGESFARFEAYFGWRLHSDKERECHDKKLQYAWPLKHRHDTVEEGTEVWNLIAEHNKYDIALYEYAKEVYQLQGSLFSQ